MSTKPKAALLPGLASRGDQYFRRVAGAGLNEFEGSARAVNTWKQYASTINRFREWCKASRLRPLPARPETVKRWIVELARSGYTNATIRAYVSGLCTWHRLQGHSLDRRPLWETLKGIKRRAAPQRKVRPLLREELRGVLAMLDQAKPIDARDGAMLAIGWANAMRRSELVGLDWQRKGVGSDATGVLHLAPDGVVIELLRSKSDQEVVVTLDLPAKHMPAAITWLKAWSAHAALKPGEPVFRAVRADGVGVARLADHSAAMIVKRRVMALEISKGASLEDAAARADDFSGHSLRAGYCTSAARAGTPEFLIRQRSRHRSAEIVAGYVRAAETRTQHGLGKVGL